jgi:trehalose-phosphatase
MALPEKPRRRGTARRRGIGVEALALRPWTQALPLVASRPHLDVFCDFDGTLAPIVPDPADATLPTRARAALAALLRRPRTRVTLVSGRPTATLRTKADVAGLSYVGNHGMEVLEGGTQQEDPVATAARPAIARVGKALAQIIAPHAGVVLEQKGISLSLHTKRAVEAVHEELGQRVAALCLAEAGLWVSSGKRVFEIRPQGAPHKGTAIERLLYSRHGAGWGRACAAFFLGDDLTDEDGFAQVAQHGAGVLVGPPPPRTQARYHAADVDDAVALLEALTHAASADPAPEETS